MKLKSLIKNIDYVSTINFKNVNICNLAHNSKDLAKNGLFFAISGAMHDGSKYVNEAISNGAVAVVTEKEIKNISLPQVIVNNVRIAMAKISKAFFNNCADKLKIIVVVGTSGKTTIAKTIYDVVRYNKIKCGFIGTNNVYIDGLDLPNNFTTPDPIDLHYTFEQMVTFGVEYVVMEVSAQSIFYHKVDGINPMLAIYTNISNEHLDFFETMENYSATKLNYLNSLKCPIIANVDDVYYGRLISKDIVSYGLSRPADIFAIDIDMSIKNLSFVCNALDNIIKIDSCLVGEHNVYNLLAVIGSCIQLGLSSEQIAKGINSITKIDGRWEIFDFPNDNVVVVDYAHTPMEFEKVLSCVKSVRSGRIITLFGCVGYSDKPKRRLMGDIAKKYSDFVVISSDNYSENFDEIFEDIGIDKYYAKIKERTKAVDFAINMLQQNDTLVLLGKGDEKIQKNEGGNEQYNEIEMVKSFLKNVE